MNVDTKHDGLEDVLPFLKDMFILGYLVMS